MVNNINFTGLSNIGGCCLKAASVADEEGERAFKSVNNLVFKLSNDFLGNDLTEYNQVLRKCKMDESDKFVKPDYIHVQTEGPWDFEFNVPPKMRVNYKEIIPERRTLPLFSYIAKLTRRIAKMDDAEFKIDEKFKYGAEGDCFIVPGTSISEISFVNKLDPELMLNQVYSPGIGRLSSQLINDDIQAQMVHYLA